MHWSYIFLALTLCHERSLQTIIHEATPNTRSKATVKTKIAQIETNNFDSTQNSYQVTYLDISSWLIWSGCDLNSWHESNLNSRNQLEHSYHIHKSQSCIFKRFIKCINFEIWWKIKCDRPSYNELYMYQIWGGSAKYLRRCSRQDSIFRVKRQKMTKPKYIPFNSLSSGYTYWSVSG